MTRSQDLDPAFASAVEAAYLNALANLSEQDAATRPSVLEIHDELLSTALYKADRTRGGIRFKRLANAGELERRLLQALKRQILG